MKLSVAKLISKHSKLSEKQASELMEIPPSPELGDFAFPCFSLSKEFKKNPAIISKELSERISKSLPKEIERVESNGPYINFFVNKILLAEKTINQILKEEDSYGKPKKSGKKIVIEFPSPNTNKPLHLGHLRNMSIGESISRILEFEGNRVVRVNLNNDRGVHICKSMLAYQKFGKNSTPEKSKMKSDHFVGYYYVLFNKELEKNPKLDEEAQNLLVKWEEGDKKALELWKKMNTWALKGFKETYKNFGVKIDKDYYESQIYKKGKEIIQDGLKKGVFFKKEDGAIAIDLKSGGLDEKVVLRSDGTSVYITQDLYLAKLKFDQYKPEKSIYVTGNEQDYHFKVLVLILKKLGFSFADRIYHLSYGMVFLPEGKMKSREGKVVEADDLIDQVKKMVKHEINARVKLSEKELEKRSLTIALAAIKYALLKIEASKNMTFNPNESISLEGNTGPYLLYSYARAKSILRKIKKGKKEINKSKPKSLNESEKALITKLSEFSEIVASSLHQMNPSAIANYSFLLCQCFNEFYHNSPVLNSENESFRLELVKAFSQTIKNALNLLGIDVLEEM